MRRTISLGSILSCVSIGLTLYFNISGTRQLIADTQPILEAVLPLIGIVFLSFGVALVCIEGRNWIKSITGRIIEDLIGFTEADKDRQLWRYYASQSYNRQTDHITDEKHIQEAENRFRAIGEKYASWLAMDCSGGDPTFDSESVKKAFRYAEIFRAHGYFRGHCRIYKDRKKRNRPDS